MDTFFERVHESDRDYVRERVGEVARRGVAVNFDFRVSAAGGGTRILNTRGEVTELDADGRPLNVVGVTHDVSERKRAEEEKDFLMRELNHRVKNNLYMINSLVHMKDAELGEEIDLSDIAHQIDAIRFVHEKLDATGKVTHINIRSYLLDLLRSLFGTFSSQPVEIDEHIENVQLRTKLAISVGLIVNETATNAVKHGFVPEHEAKFSISLGPGRAKSGEERFTLSMSNTGKPFPEHIDLDNPASLGLRLITALVAQIEGTIELERSPYPVFTITFPVDEEDVNETRT
jgi:two-component sensor histidine kinase